MLEYAPLSHPQPKRFPKTGDQFANFITPEVRQASAGNANLENPGFRTENDGE